jgi:16S rRNA (guanine527-N7)-methyltransferase
MNKCPDQVVEFLLETGIPENKLTPCLERCAVFGDLLVAANREVNLTRLTDDNDFWIKHVADSLAVVGLLPNLLDASLRLCDVGCGAGLPAIPLALLNPELDVTALDGTGKKIDFVQNVKKSMALENVQPIWGRAEEIGHKKKYREAFDVLTLRAVGAAPKILPKCTQLLDPELGMMILYKTPNAIEKEHAEAEETARELNVALDLSPPFELPMDAGARQFMIVTPLDE